MDIYYISSGVRVCVLLLFLKHCKKFKGFFSIKFNQRNKRSSPVSINLISALSTRRYRISAFQTKVSLHYTTIDIITFVTRGLFEDCIAYNICVLPSSDSQMFIFPCVIRISWLFIEQYTWHQSCFWYSYIFEFLGSYIYQVCNLTRPKRYKSNNSRSNMYCIIHARRSYTHYALCSYIVD